MAGSGAGGTGRGSRSQEVARRALSSMLSTNGYVSNWEGINSAKLCPPCVPSSTACGILGHATQYALPPEMLQGQLKALV